ncbi:MAG: glucose-6-phosphate dehydrogenase [Tepidisphaerales bacterium]
MFLAAPCAIVIFGASGDLARRKLIPAIYELAREGLLHDRSYIVGFSRSSLTDEQFREECRASIAQFARTKPLDDSVWRKLLGRIYYCAADYASAADYARVARRLGELDRVHQAHGSRLFYHLATPPAQFLSIIEQLARLIPPKDSALPAADAADAVWHRLIIEKPFGHDLLSAQRLNSLVHRHFREEQVFRIDHFLGKETVQNLMVMRFANSIFEPIWNYKYIDHVQITVAESLGVGSRGGYYDQSGALRDMVQNHMFQLLALVAIEPPVALDAQSIRDEKVKVFRSIRQMRPAVIEQSTVRGQYAAGSHAGQSTEGYRREKGVSPDSRTETFAAVKLHIDNWRWSGTPFYLRTGKFLEQKLSEVVVRFRSPPLTLFQKQCESPVFPNDLVIRVQPNEGISVRLNGKVPGGQMNIRSVAMDFTYTNAFQTEPPEAYERLIHDAMAGDQTLFIRADEAEAAWQVIDPIETTWAQSSRAPADYAPGSWGPPQALDLIERDGRRWLHSTGEAEPIIACSV